MTQARFKIVFSGELMPDMALDTVKDNLAQLFKSNRSRVESLFSGANVPIKRDLPEDEADKYLIALQNAGAKVRKEPDLAASLTLVDTETPEPAQTVVSMNCPKCGHTQAKSNECSACGIIIDKYLARQAQLAANPPPQPQPAASADPSPYSTPKAQVAEELSDYAELKVFSVQGRIGRVRYLGWSAALLFIAMIVYGLVMGAIALSPTLGIILAIPAAIATIVVSVQIGVQRLHDLGWSGWLWLLNFVPVIGSVLALLLLVVPGNTGANRYGPPPPPNSRGVVALAWSMLLIPILGILAAIAIPSYQDYTERAEQAQHTDSATTIEE
ncbi:DUF805 domain-containing protein [Aquipseudomonas ullengensis]|uniref:DUF805 domain-containing protein n=1 Tax=Aquipseudomonas ullengensis TaxID=2759166 RepID=A0A7W4LP07_9GAMM|nr:DUF805 domain-containing protein [Pseudomonas ullengensis]MBB2496705.1 DUF805 domain-containing protein [Pseudomonas ullengensis]